MKVNCDYCGSFIESTDEQCPNCGAVNTHFVRTASDTPKTIEELKAYCVNNKLPLEKMHVHLGEDYKAPKAFGIYKDQSTGHFVVYKNKASGERAVRYEGTDEAYAVNEIYTKIKDLVMDAREAASKNKQYRSPNNPYYNRQPSKKKGSASTVVALIIVGIVVFSMIFALIKDNSRNGYYEYNGDTYYRHGSYWYMYDDELDSWDRADNMSSYIDDDDYLGKGYDSDYDAEVFPEDDFSDDWKSDWDSDDDWSGDNDNSWDDSYDSYDYDSGDWDSDW